MSIVVLAALILSIIIYLYIGLNLGKKTKDLGDMLPVVTGKTARVNNSDEFSASTVATTISLATIIVAYFELAAGYGLWLLWTVITTGLGLAIVSFASKQIWKKLSEYDHRPSLHEFLGSEYKSPAVALVGAICTSIGFLLIFATELTVGSLFLATLIPEIPEWITVVVLSFVGFVYTFAGGFRAVVKTDQIQMKFIWGLIIVLIGFYLWHFLSVDTITANFQKIPTNILDFSWRPGLGAFLLGIAIMNIPTHISNMSVWQRISGAQEPKTVEFGLRKSIWGATASWGLLVLLACFSFAIITPPAQTNLLSGLLITVAQTKFGLFVLFFVVLGLYGAMLSTASTNLIVVAHTVYEDIYARFHQKSLKNRISSNRELNISRIILFLTAIFVVGLVEGLKMIGFSIADLVFAIYGGQLALFPAILFALYVKPAKLQKIGNYANMAILTGVLLGWGAAFTGKICNHPDLIFLAPGISISSAFFVLGFGLLITKSNTEN